MKPRLPRFLLAPARRGASSPFRIRRDSLPDTRCLSSVASRRPRPERSAERISLDSASLFRDNSLRRDRLPMRRREIGRRGLHATSVRNHGGIERPIPGTGIKVTFKDSKGNVLKTVEANEGDDILSIAHEYDIDLEGACEGSIACSTCHVILDPEHYDMLEEPGDDENDMLDMAFGLTDTSRLGCQVKVTRELDGIVCTLPAATRNMYVDGSKPHH